MSWIWKRKSKKDKEQALHEDREENSPPATDEAKPSLPLRSGTYPTPLFTLIEHSEEDSKIKSSPVSHSSEASSNMTLKVPTHRPLRRPQPASFSSDVGYQSQTSRSTIADDLSVPFRERTVSGASSVSSYYSPQGSVNFAPSPTRTPNLSPSFPVDSKDDVMQSLKESVEKISELVTCLQCRVEELTQRVGKLEDTRAAERRSSVSLHPKIEYTACRNDAILWLVEKVTDWKFLARRLGLENNIITRIELDYQGDRERCYQMFMRWKAMDAENYTYRALGTALLKESKALYIEYVNEVHHLENIRQE